MTAAVLKYHALDRLVEPTNWFPIQDSAGPHPYSRHGDREQRKENLCTPDLLDSPGFVRFQIQPYSKSQASPQANILVNPNSKKSRTTPRISDFS